MCQISKCFLLAKKVLLSPGVGAHIQPGITAFVDEEELSAGTEAWHEGLSTLKETSSFSAVLHGFTVSLCTARCRALHNWLYPACCMLDHLGCSCSLQAATPFVSIRCLPRLDPVTPLPYPRCWATLCPAATREPGARHQVLAGGSAAEEWGTWAEGWMGR